MSGCPLPPLLRLPVLLLFLPHLPHAQSQTVTTIEDTFSHSFPNCYSFGNGANFSIFNDSGYSSPAISPSKTPSTYLVKRSGRVFYNRPFKLSQVLSFNASFKINVFFCINDMTLTTTWSSLSSTPSGRPIWATATTTTSASTFSDLNSSIVPVNNTNYTVWIDYDGVVRYLRVYMAIDDDHDLKPASAVLEAPLDLSDYLKEFYFGFAASTVSNYELNPVKSWNLTVQMLTDGRKGVPPWKIGAIVGGVLMFVMALGAGLFVWLKMRKRMPRDAAVSSSNALVLGTELKSLPGMLREFEFEDLDKATSNFDENMKLGQGGFGVVYRGVLPEENKEVAVKRFSREGTSAHNDFLNELTIINRLRHKNLVPLVGWCHTHSMLLLVYEYMPNGSLDHHLFDGPNSQRTTTLSWARRYNVIAGVASALHYLHDLYDQKVVHRDLKASNIMLDANFNARLGDFGLARAIESNNTSYAELEMGGVPGTLGYIAPECFHTGKATRESDIFGFGAVVLEVVCGRQARCDIDGFQFLCDWVWKLFREGHILEAVDARLGEDYDPEDARRLLLLALACSHPISSERPKTDVTVQIISRTVAPPAVPHFRPSFVWPSFPAMAGASSGLTFVSASSFETSPTWRSPHLPDRDGHVAPTDTSLTASSSAN